MWAQISRMILRSMNGLSFAITTPKCLRWQCRDRRRNDFQELPSDELDSVFVLLELLYVDLGRIELETLTWRPSCHELDERNNEPTEVVVPIYSCKSGKETRAC